MLALLKSSCLKLPALRAALGLPSFVHVYALLVYAVCAVTGYTLLGMWHGLAGGAADARLQFGAPALPALGAAGVAQQGVSATLLSRNGDKAARQVMLGATAGTVVAERAPAAPTDPVR